MTDFLAHLKQRKLVQWALAYLATAWVLLQVLDLAAGSYHWPDMVMHVAFGVLALGFVVALVLAWYHGERGVQRVTGVELLLIALVLAVGGGLLWHFGWTGPKSALVQVAVTGTRTAAAMGAASAVTSASLPHSSAVALAVPIPAQAIPAKSIAVLPFENDSGTKDQQYFSDGLSADLITALSQFAGLKVINRNSAFQFRNSQESIKVIAQKLGVAHLLEGSVQRAGDEVRVTASLVNAADGSVLWSDRYDKPYKDLFALQDAITSAVAGALKAKLLSAPGAVVQSERPPSGNLSAWSAYSRGVAYIDINSEQSLHTAVVAFSEAARLDPRYAASYAQLSRSWSALAIQFLDDAQRAQAYSEAREDVQTALRLDPESSLAHQARSLLLWANLDWAGAETEGRRAVQLAPDNGLAKFQLSTVLAALGQNARAAGLIRQALQIDPRNALWYDFLATYLTALGQLDAAQQAADTAIALAPSPTVFNAELVTVKILRGDVENALAAAKQLPLGGWQSGWVTVAMQIGPDRAAADTALTTLIAEHPENRYLIADAYALRHDPSHMFQWLDRAWANRDSSIHQVLSDPFILRYRTDPRFAAFCKQVGLPATTDAKAMP
jgi:TolB-like protein/Tfp pilus assembly protein PilF